MRDYIAMKRSMTVSLVLLGSAAMGMGLTACKPKAESYQSVEACEEAGQHTDQECRDAFATAQREHEASAKHFQSREECLAAYGPNGCEERRAEGGGSFFMPMMMGYMLGRGLGYHPLYQDPSRNGMVAPGGTRFSSYSGGGASGGGLFSRRSASGGAETSTVSRGGFGESGHFSGGG